MIEGPPILTIRRSLTRVDATLLSGFQDAMTGHLVDAMDGRGALDRAVKPHDPARASICGPALTVFCYPADNLALLAACAQVQPGDVVVCTTDGHLQAAVTGDLLLGMLKNAGAAALVTDATIRDQSGVEAVGLPIFHAGVTPNSPASVGPGSIGLPITCGGVRIDSGDIVVGDRDGVVIVPHAQAAATLARLERVRAAEVKLEAAVKSGLKVPDHIAELLASDRIGWVD
ncbi:MAG: RraA family protein [Rhodospirillaceae bacterium]